MFILVSRPRLEQNVRCLLLGGELRLAVLMCAISKMCVDRLIDFAPTTSMGMILGMTDGDQVAWKRFVRGYSGVIYSICRNFELSPEDSADVLQEVFHKVHLRIGEFRRNGSGKEFRRWLRTIARNVIMDHFRVDAKHRDAVLAASMLEELREMPPFSVDETDSIEEKDSFSSSDSSLSSSFSSQVRHALFVVRTDYEEKTWKAFWRTAVDGQRSVDVAEELGMPSKNVRQAKYKILRHLRRELESRGM